MSEVKRPKTSVTLRTVEDLRGAGLVAPATAEALRPVVARYATAITPAMAALIDPRDAQDPIARQFIPDIRELEELPGERADPIGDDVHEAVPGVIHRYPDRVLLKLTHSCPIYCRFCFRREMVGPGGKHALDEAALDRALGYIASHTAIFEVILTGGDPLILSPRRLAHVTRRLSMIPHVQILRWHTRVPIVAPDRISPDLIEALTATTRPVYIGVHVNHPRELTPAARKAIADLTTAGLSLISQTVLLRGINADAAILEELFRQLVTLRVRPYYLHLADLAPGTGHFRTGIDEARAIMQRLRGRVSGLALPTLVLDIPGGHGKVPIGPDHVLDDGTAVLDNNGRTHPYPGA
jgi:lysine 2,3-aminomutase